MDMPDDDKPTKKPVHSLEDIDDNMREEETPTEEDVLRAQLKKDAKENSLDDEEEKLDSPEEDDDDDEEEEKEEKDEEDSDEAEEDEDPLDEGDDDPEYMEKVEEEEEKGEDAPSAPEEVSEETEVAEEPLPERRTFKTNFPIPAKESTLDDLAKEPISEEPEEEAMPTQRPTMPPYDNPMESRSQYQPVADEPHIPNLRNRGQAAEFGPASMSQPVYQQAERNPFPNRYYPERSKKSNKWHLLVLALLGIGVIGASVYLLKSQFGGLETSPSPSPTSVETTESSPQPSPSPIVTVDRSKFKVKVLNGTTTSGLAGTVSDKLKELGYQMEKPGNAAKQDYTSTVIRVKSSATGLADQLIKDLGSDYPASESGTLKDSDTFDAEVTLGKK